ncbi:MAG: hypothetical protein ACRDPF_28310 [Streptosporangiaceae bacterium]
MKYYTTDPGAKGRFIRALRELADYLDRNPAIPVPKTGETVTLHASPIGSGGRAQVDHIAKLLGTGIRDETARGGHYWAVRQFGPIGYEIVAISDMPPAPGPTPICYHSAAPDTWT